VIFVGSKGDIVLANSKAEELLRKRDGVLLVGGKLRAVLTSESARLQAKIAGAAGSGNGNELTAGGTILLSRKMGRSLRVTVAPLRNGAVELEQPSAVLFISDPDQSIEPPSELLRQCYGLTVAESRLATVLLEGCSLKEAA